MTRRLLILASAMAVAGCAEALGEQEVCEFLRGRTATPAPPEGEAAWEWTDEAREIIQSRSWVEADGATVRRCTSDPMVERVAFDSRGDHAQLTLNSFLLPAPTELDEAVELSGSVETCLYRRERTSPTEQWVGIACKLDAVS